MAKTFIASKSWLRRLAEALTQLHPKSLSQHLIIFDFFHMAAGQYLFQKVKSDEQTGGVEIGFATHKYGLQPTLLASPVKYDHRS